MRTRYSIINMLFNIGGQFLTMLLSFINRMVFIRCLSAEYLGVNGLFTDVLSILNFAEPSLILRSWASVRLWCSACMNRQPGMTSRNWRG